MEKHRKTCGGREKPKAEVKLRAHQEHVETRCTLFLNGWKISEKNLVEEECSETEVRTPQVLLKHQRQPRQKKWCWYLENHTDYTRVPKDRNCVLRRRTKNYIGSLLETHK